MDSQLVTIVLYAALAGACIPIGGLLASMENIRPAWLEHEFRHGVIAFGGGVLLAAVSLVLIPEGNHYMGMPLWGTAIVLFGGLAFFWFERFLASRKADKPQLMAMLLDYIPESIALGGTLALGSQTALLLALFIGLQNIPEGFNAYREMREGSQDSRRRILLVMLALVPVGPVMGVIGYLWLSQFQQLLGAIMLFAAGGILYLIFQDIAPQAHMRRHWGPPLGAVAGFCLGMAGQALLHG